MVDEGLPPETIDAAAKDFGMPMGPIELADMVGLDIGWAVGQELAKPGSPIPKKLKALVEAKQFGKKTGQGFYTWVKGKPRKTLHRAPARVDLKALADRMVIPALNEAVACVREKIVADADLCDAGVIFGTGFAPHRGGPIHDDPRSAASPSCLAIMEELRKQARPALRAGRGLGKHLVNRRWRRGIGWRASPSARRSSRARSAGRRRTSPRSGRASRNSGPASRACR